jgi:hypothetical protein
MRPRMSRRVIAMIAVTGAVATGCNDDEPSTAATPAPVASEAATTAAPIAATTPATTDGAAGGTSASAGSATTRFSDDFVDDRNGWGLVDDPQFGGASYADGDYVWNFRGSLAHWLPAVLGDQYDAGELQMVNVVVRADLTISSGNGVAGVFCRENPDTDADWQWYEFVVRDGYGAIRLADAEGNLTPLAETESLSLPLGTPIVLEARCADDESGAAKLALTVNGSPLLDATVEEGVLGNGVAGLQAWTFPAHEQMDIAWHSFSVDPAV